MLPNHYLSLREVRLPAIVDVDQMSQSRKNLKIIHKNLKHFFVIWIVDDDNVDSVLIVCVYDPSIPIMDMLLILNILNPERSRSILYTLCIIAKQSQ